MNHIWMKYLLGIPLFFVGALLSFYNYTIPALLIFFASIMIEVYLCYKQIHQIFDLRILLSISWLGGIGLSCLKLSSLQNAWGIITWFALGGFYFSFLLAFDVLFLIQKKKKNPIHDVGKKEKKNKSLIRTNPDVFLRRMKQSILAVFFIGVGMFLIESIILGYIPLFSKDTHAYNEFHITGLHYFTCSVMLMHPLSVIYGFQKKPNRKEVWELIILNLIGFSIPVLCLSKFQILIAVALPAITWAFLMQNRVSKKRILGGFFLLLVGLSIVFVVVVIGRKYPEGYLEKAFEFRDKNVPMVLQYPYMYVVNNFENLNLTVVNLSGFSYGGRQLFPLLALTGLKFLPAVSPLLSFPVYYTKETLNTVTILLDAYGDFGLLGCILFGLVLGAVSAWLTGKVVREQKILGMMFYGQLAVYFSLSFFSTWFSVPTTWFWFIATALIYIYCSRTRRKENVNEKQIA